MNKTDFTILPKETFIKIIENSVGTKMFNSVMVQMQNGEQKDIMNDGEFSCAFYVSGILVIMGLLPKTRSTVKSLLEDISVSDKFVEVNESEISAGDIIFWEAVTFPDGSVNKHVGFYLGEGEAVSTNYIEKQVVRHAYKKTALGDEKERGIEKVFRIN